MEKKFLNCPACGEPLSMPEYNAQECWMCGWPDEDKAPDTTTKRQDKVPEQCDTEGGLTPFLQPPNPIKGALNPLPEHVSLN